MEETIIRDGLTIHPDCFLSQYIRARSGKADVVVFRYRPNHSKRFDDKTRYLVRHQDREGAVDILDSEYCTTFDTHDLVALDVKLAEAALAKTL